MEKILDELYDYMQQENLTQKEVAKIINVDTATISRWRSGSKVGAKNLRALKLLTRKETLVINNDDHFAQVAFDKWSKLSENNRDLAFKYMIDLLHSQKK